MTLSRRSFFKLIGAAAGITATLSACSNIDRKTAPTAVTVTKSPPLYPTS